MTTNRIAARSVFVIACASAGAILQAQGRGGAEWTTSGSDAQRTAWVRTDPRISAATMVKAGPFGPFKFLWKLKLEYDPKAATTLTQPILLNNVIGFRGFKSIVFVATASETVHAIDYDVGAPLWKYHVNYTASPPPLTVGTNECPAGLVAAPSRPTAFAPPTAAGRGGAAPQARCPVRPPRRRAISRADSRAEHARAARAVVVDAAARSCRAVTRPTSSAATAISTR